MASKLYGILAFAGGTGGMSAWQFHRYFWKKDLLDSRAERLSGEPITELPKEAPSDICPVRIRGTFYNDSAFLVGPKKASRTAYGKVSTPESYVVLVPFITTDNKHVMVNKGQVPTDVVSSGKLKDILSAWPTNVEIEGVFRKPQRPRAHEVVRRDETFYRLVHPAMMWTDFYDKYGIKESARKPLPYWIDVTGQPFESEDNLPLTRDSLSYATHVITPAVHGVYFLTWTALFGIALYNVNRHGARLLRKGSETREQMLGGVRNETETKW
ncbi:SURF1-like protein [Diplonema papillatum]|nr:SURF1-like protein [Diplonema papillatum]